MKYMRRESMDWDYVFDSLSEMCPSYSADYCMANVGGQCQHNECPFIYWAKCLIVEEEDDGSNTGE